MRNSNIFKLQGVETKPHLKKELTTLELIPSRMQQLQAILALPSKERTQEDIVLVMKMT